MPLLDELVDMLGRDTVADKAAERAAAAQEQRAEAEYAVGVMDI